MSKIKSNSVPETSWRMPKAQNETRVDGNANGSQTMEDTVRCVRKSKPLPCTVQVGNLEPKPQAIETDGSFDCHPVNLDADEEPKTKRKKSPRVREAHRFPDKLMTLTNSCTSGAIGWDPSGRFVYIRFKQFKREYLDKHSVFKTDNTSSFVRQLNLYGFRKVTVPRILPLESDLNYFHNQSFLRDYPHLAVNVIRSYSNQKQGPNQRPERQQQPVNVFGDEKIGQCQKAFSDALNKQAVNFAAKRSSGSQLSDSIQVGKENIQKRQYKKKGAENSSKLLSRREESYIDFCLRQLEVPSYSNFNFLFQDLELLNCENLKEVSKKPKSRLNGTKATAKVSQSNANLLANNGQNWMTDMLNTNTSPCHLINAPFNQNGGNEGLIHHNAQNESNLNSSTGDRLILEPVQELCVQKLEAIGNVDAFPNFDPNLIPDIRDFEIFDY